VIQGFQLFGRVAHGKVITPSSDYQVQVVNDLCHGYPLAAVPRVLSDLAPYRFHRFLPGPEVRQQFARSSVGPLMKVEPQKLETFPAQIHQASLGGVQRQFQFLQDTPLSLRPDDSLTIREMALSIGFQDLVSLLPTIQATGFWLLP
jgi:hypothetical protein